MIKIDDRDTVAFFYYYLLFFTKQNEEILKNYSVYSNYDELNDVHFKNISKQIFRIIKI